MFIRPVHFNGSAAFSASVTPASDIDLRIDKGRIRGIEMGGLLLDLEDALGVPVDLIPTSSLSERFLSSIQKDEVLLYEA